MNILNYWMFATYLSPAILIAGVFIGLFKYKKLDQVHRILVWYLIASLIVDLTSRYIGLFSTNRYNLFLIPLWGFIELFIFSIIYIKMILEIKNKVPLGFILLVHLFILFELFFSPLIHSRQHYISFGKPLANLIIILYCMIFFYRLVIGHKNFKKKYSALNNLIFIFYSINLLLYLFINFLVNEDKLLVTYFWLFNLVSVLLFNLILILIIWRNGKTQKLLQQS